MFEVEVAAVDETGAFHPLFNFGQGLPLGAPWSFDFPADAGILTASVTWEGRGSDQTPKVTLSLRPSDPGGATGAVVLEKLVWDSLFGPEAFTASEGKPFVLPKYGRVFAVASVVPTPCGE